MSLEERITGFATLLRRYGIRVSHSQIRDALEAVALVGLERQAFRCALACTLIKEKSDLEVFAALFLLYFKARAAARPEEGTGGPLNEAEEDERPQEETARVENAGPQGVITQQNLNAQLKGLPHVLLAQAVREGDFVLLQQLAHKGVEELGPLSRDDVRDVPGLLQKAKAALGWQKAMDLVFGKRVFSASF